MKAIFDGNLIDLQIFQPGAENRAFQYGDGLFETLLSRNGKIQLLEDHFDRVRAGCRALFLTLPEYFSPVYLENQVSSLIEQNNLSPVIRIKLMIWRLDGGMYMPDQKESHHLIMARNFLLQPPMELNRIGFCSRVVNFPSPWAAFKTLSSLPYVLAGVEKKEKNLDDIILTDHLGHISELLYSNIFWIKDRQFYTPSLDTGCIRGVMRTFLLRKLRLMKNPVYEVKCGKETLLDSDFVFSANVMGLRPVTSIEDRKFKPYAGLQELLP